MAKTKTKPDSECKLTWLGLRLRADEKQALGQAARREGVTASDLVRRSIAPLLGQTETTGGNPRQGPAQAR